MLTLLANIGYIVFVAASLIFTVMFLTMSKTWYQTFMGSIIAIFLISMDILCVFFGLRIWQVALPGVEWMRFILFWVLGLTMVGAILAFVNVQFSKRGEKLRNRLAKKYDDVKEVQPNER